MQADVPLLSKPHRKKLAENLACGAGLGQTWRTTAGYRRGGPFSGQGGRGPPNVPRRLCPPRIQGLAEPRAKRLAYDEGCGGARCLSPHL